MIIHMYLLKPLPLFAICNKEEITSEIHIKPGESLFS